MFNQGNPGEKERIFKISGKIKEVLSSALFFQSNDFLNHKSS